SKKLSEYTCGISTIYFIYYKYDQPGAFFSTTNSIEKNAVNDLKTRFRLFIWHITFHEIFIAVRRMKLDAINILCPILSEGKCDVPCVPRFACSWRASQNNA